jgi:hypothetical protein
MTRALTQIKNFDFRPASTAKLPATSIPHTELAADRHLQRAFAYNRALDQQKMQWCNWRIST